MSTSDPGTPKKFRRKSPVSDRRSNSSSAIKLKRRPLSRRNASESEGESDENDSIESEQTDSQESKSTRRGARKSRSDWKVIDDGEKVGYEDKAEKYEGFMMKRRKWPLKGWHKRYFVLENGMLTYAKTQNDIVKGKMHGTVDIGLHTVVTFKRDSRRIDIDAEDLIYHLKVKNTVLFDEWLQKLRHHRIYRQNELTYGTKDAPKLTDVVSSPVDELTPITSPVSPSGYSYSMLVPSPVVSPLTPGSSTLTERRRGSITSPNTLFFERNLPERHRGSIKSRNLTLLERSQSKVTAWLMDTTGIERCNKDLTSAQAHVYELGTLLDKLYSCSLTNHTVGPDAMFDLHDIVHSPKKEKSGRRVAFRMVNRKNKSQSQSQSQEKDTASLSCSLGSADLKVPDGMLHLSSSNPNLLTNHEAERSRPTSMPDPWPSSEQIDAKLEEIKLREDFLSTAKSVHETLRSLTRTISTERERLKHAFEQERGATMQVNANYINSLKTALSESLKQNTDLRARLNRIHADSNISTIQPSPVVEEHPLLQAAASWESTSASEFYDAAEYLMSSGATSEVSDEEEEEEVSSEISDTENTAAETNAEMAVTHLATGRRSKLPAMSTQEDISVWGLLCKNIGKDLSKISMPVTLNEPINTLQRLCEELEYSEMLDKTEDIEDPYQRMVLVAAFSVSPYASTYYRAGQKPFNPLLGETYECIREDKGWRYIAEQVSHHPPISACYADSKHFTFWQDMRVKSKFWGKSMEIQPIGQVHLTLPRWNDKYRWNKVTTCVHNILGGQRWVDHYGECTIKNEANGIICKLTYAKSSYWSEKRHEVYGTVLSPEGKVVHHIFGKWNEGIYYGHAPSAKCVWRPGSMPEDYELYYGFTRFAIELNELDPDHAHLYAPTDTRFRPDQRALEEGRIQGAENEKNRLEQFQRERRKQREEENVQYSPRWFMRDEDSGKSDMYRYTGKYWELRKDPGFMQMSFTKLW